MSSRIISLKETDTSFILNGDLFKIDNSLKSIAEDNNRNNNLQKAFAIFTGYFKCCHCQCNVTDQEVKHPIYSITFVTFLSIAHNGPITIVCDYWLYIFSYTLYGLDYYHVLISILCQAPVLGI